MGYRASKHPRRLTPIEFPDFIGVDYSKPPESIDLNMLQKAHNYEKDYTEGMLRTAPGTELYYNAEIAMNSLFWADNLGLWLFNSGQDLYKTDGFTKTKIGVLSGLRKPMYVIFDEKVIVASGGKLQYTTGNELTNIDSPDLMDPDRTIADIVYVENGRVVISRAGLDEVKWSGIGDALEWDYDANDASKAWVEPIGYKDAGDIVAIGSLSQDLVVGKSNGIFYRVVGKPPAIEGILEIGRDVPAMNRFCVATANNDLFFVGSNGFKGLATVQEYGSVKSFESGRAINPILPNLINQEARLWHIPSKSQIWFRMNDTSKTIWLFHYLEGGWTSREFTTPIQEVVEKDNEVYVVKENRIVKLNKLLDTDEGTDIKTSLKTKRISGINKYLVTQIILEFSNLTAGAGTLSIDKAVLPVSIGEAPATAWNNNTPAWTNDDGAWQARFKNYKIRVNFRADYLEVSIESSKGSYGVRKIALIVSEVG